MFFLYNYWVYVESVLQLIIFFTKIYNDILLFMYKTLMADLALVTNYKLLIDLYKVYKVY